MCERIQAFTGREVNQEMVVVRDPGTVVKDMKKALAPLLRTKNGAKLTKYYRRISLTDLEGSLEIWRKHDTYSLDKSSEYDDVELMADPDESLFMEEGEEISREEIR
jgi:hypothetical protein